MMKKIIGVLSAVFVVGACGADDDTDTGSDDGGNAVSWQPLAADEKYRDRTLEQWAVEWVRWYYGQTSCESTLTDPDGSLCSLYQDPNAEVFFLNMGFAADRTLCNVPSNKAILVPLIATAHDNVHEGPNESDDSEDVLRERAATDKDSMRDLRLVVDGISIKGLDAYGVGPVRHQYEVPKAPNFYSCQPVPNVAEVTVDPSYLAGYFVLLPPPPQGKHALEYSAVFTYDGDEVKLSVTTTFSVGSSR